MNENDLRNLPWVELKDWTKLPSSVPKIFIDKVEENLCQKIAIELNILPKIVKRVFRSKNKFFYSLKNKFEWAFPLDSDDFRMINLKKALRVPDMQMIKVEHCKALYEELSETDKLKFLVDEMELLKEMIGMQIEIVEGGQQ